MAAINERLEQLPGRFPGAQDMITKMNLDADGDNRISKEDPRQATNPASRTLFRACRHHCTCMVSRRVLDQRRVDVFAFACC